MPPWGAGTDRMNATRSAMKVTTALDQRPVMLASRNVWKVYGRGAQEVMAAAGGKPSAADLNAAGLIGAVRDASVEVKEGEIFIIMAQGKRGFVDKLDFFTSIGHVTGGDSRQKLGVKTKGPTRLITDLALFEPDPETKEMIVTAMHPGVTRDQIKENTGWQVRFAAKVAETAPPTGQELDVLREIQARTARAHAAA